MKLTSLSSTSTANILFKSTVMAEVFTPIVGTFIFVVYRKFYWHELPSSVNIYNYGCAVNCSATYRLTYSVQLNYNNNLLCLELCWHIVCVLRSEAIHISTMVDSITVILTGMKALVVTKQTVLVVSRSRLSHEKRESVWWFSHYGLVP